MPDTSQFGSDEVVDFEIELGAARALPQQGNGIKISLNRMVQRQILEYAASDTAKELGGILLGMPEDSETGTDLQVSAMLKAKKTAADKTSLTFTHETWEQIHHEKDILYPDLKIVGWFHTHPGFGIFLSNYDTFIQQNFFNLSWQVAYVVDPIRQEQGFFAWENSQVIPVPYQVNDEGKSIWMPLEEEAPTKNQVRESVEKGHEDTTAVYGKKNSKNSSSGWLKAVIIISVLLLILTNTHRFVPAQENHLKIQLAEQKAQNEALALELQRYQEQMSELQNQYQQMEMSISELSGDRFFSYKVLPGDTLWSISSRYYDDPTEYIYIMRLNNLENPDNLEVGQTLLLYKQGD